MVRAVGNRQSRRPDSGFGNAGAAIALVAVLVRPSQHRHVMRCEREP
jgi:hypothetical protein